MFDRRIKSRTVFNILSLFLILFSLFSCSKDDNREIPVTERELPDMILINADYTFGQPDKKPLLLHADSITIYPVGQRMEIQKVSFTQKSSNENSDLIELSGKCDYAVSTDNVNIQMTGNVNLYKYTDDVEITCEELIWDDNNQEIKADGNVTVKYKNGTSITGTGFKALLNENVYEFKTIYEGKYTGEEE